MIKNKPFESVIKKIWNDINFLENKINSLPDVNLFTLPIAVLRSFLAPTSIKELQEELTNIRSKAQSTLEQYARVTNDTDLKVQVVNEDSTELKTTYLSQIIEIMEYITSLEHILKEKDLQQVLASSTTKTPNKNNTNKTHSRSQNIPTNQIKTDWDDLSL